MAVLFGHPGGNPNSHHAALSHFESGRLSAFCVPWMPSKATLALMHCVPGIRDSAGRFERRHFAPLARAPLIQGRCGELLRLLRRQFGRNLDHEGLSYEANDWLMRTMAKECHRRSVSTVHSYEDCSLLQFQEACRLGKACIYDMPIGYYRWWEDKQETLRRRYLDWLPEDAVAGSQFVRPQQKQEEMELADLVLAPSEFVARTIREFFPDKLVKMASYGVDLDFWSPCETPAEPESEKLNFLFAGQIGLRKGAPVLLDAWRAAHLRNAHLHLVGRWSLSKKVLENLPPNVSYHGLCSRGELRNWYRRSDVLVFPTFFEGFPLVVLEAMACGLPVISTEVLAGMNLLVDGCGIQVPSGDPDALLNALVRVASGKNPALATREVVRNKVTQYTWESYRHAVTQAVKSV